MTSTAWGAVATKCVDGVTTGSDYCHGGSSSGDTLTVTLPSTGIVTRIEIWNRPGQESRMVGAEVKAGDTLCETVSASQAKYVITCSSVETDTVTITTVNWLNLIEVKVFGRSKKINW